MITQLLFSALLAIVLGKGKAKKKQSEKPFYMVEFEDADNGQVDIVFRKKVDAMKLYQSVKKTRKLSHQKLESLINNDVVIRRDWDINTDKPMINIELGRLWYFDSSGSGSEQQSFGI